MDTLRSMHYLVRAIERGSLSAVAREQGTTQPTVSKVLDALERSLGVRLLERSTSGLTPTEQGMRFYERAKIVLEEFENAVAEARGLTEKPAGLLRINAPVALGQFRLNRLIQEFLALHPDIDIELILNDRFVDLVEEGVDIALRLGDVLPPQAVARRIATSNRILVAAPDYLKSRGHPRRPADLEQHDYIRFAWATAGEAIELHGGSASVTVAATGRYRVNNAIAIRESLAMGSGIGLCPAWLVHDLIESGKLVRVLPKWAATPQELFLLYPSRRYLPLRGKLFMDFISSRLVQLPGFEAPYA
jgi:DNA-binding transcriptional LysR family regulator